MKCIAIAAILATIGCSNGTDSTGPTQIPTTFGLKVQEVASGLTNPL